MFSRIVRRASSLPTKISFQIDVQKVVFAASKHLPVGALVIITFERGEHSVSTGAYPVQAFRDGTHGVVVGEALVLACTMYKDSAGKYQEKKGRLVLRQIIKDKNGAETVKAHGTVQLDLESIAAHGERQEATFPLGQSGLSGGRVVVVITTQNGEGSDMDSEEHMSRGAVAVTSPSLKSSASDSHDLTADHNFPSVESSSGSPSDSWVEVANDAGSDRTPFKGEHAKTAASPPDALQKVMAERDKLQGELSKAQRSLAASQGSSTTLYSQIGNKEGECDALRRQIDQLVETMDLERSSHETTVSELIDEISVLKSQLSVSGADNSSPDVAGVATRVAALEEEVARLENELKIKCDSEQNAQLELQKNIEQLTESETQREVGDALVADLSRQLELSKSELADMESAFKSSKADLQLRIDQFEIEMTEKNDTNVTLENELDAVNATLADLRQRNAEREDITEVEKELNDKVDSLSFQLSTTTAQLNALVAEKKVADAKISFLSEELDSAKQQESDLQGRVDELQLSVKQTESARQELEYELVRMKTLLTDANADTTAEAEKVLKLQKQLEDLKDELTNAQETARKGAVHSDSEHSAAMAELVRENESLQQKLQESEAAQAAVLHSAPTGGNEFGDESLIAPADSTCGTPMHKSSQEDENADAKSKPYHDHGPFNLDFATALSSYKGQDRWDETETSTPTAGDRKEVMELLSAAQETISSLQTTIEQMEQDNSDEINLLKEVNASLLERVDTLRKQNLASVSRADNLREALDQELRGTKDELSSCQSQLHESEVELASSRDRVAALSAQLSGTQAKLASLRASSSLEISKLKSSFLMERSGSNDDSSIDRNNSRDMDEFVNKYKQEMEALLQVKQCRVSELEEESSGLRDQLSAANTLVVELEKELEDTKLQTMDSSQDSVAKLAALENECSVLRAHVDVSSARVIELEREVEELKLETTVSSQDSATKIIGLQNTCESLSSQLSQLEGLRSSHLANSSTEIDQLKYKLVEESELHEQLQLAIRDEVSSFKEKYETATSEIVDLKETIEKMKYDIAHSQEHTKIVEEANEQLVHDLMSSRDEGALLSRKASQLEDDKQLLLEEIDTLRSCPPPPPVPCTPSISIRRESADAEWTPNDESGILEYSPTADYSGFGEFENGEMEEIARLRSTLHDKNTEIGRLQELYIDVCSKFEEGQAEMATIRARQEVEQISENSGGNADVWLGELIQAKVLAANTATELDIQKKNSSSLQKTIVVYSERIAKLETELMSTKEAQRASPEKKKFFKGGLKLPGTSKKEAGKKKPTK